MQGTFVLSKAACLRYYLFSAHRSLEQDRDEALSVFRAHFVLSGPRTKVIVESIQTGRCGTELGSYLRDNEYLTSLGIRLLIYPQESLKWKMFKSP